jgi:hypothetical protein
MDNNVLVAAIISGGSGLAAITALVLGHRGFTSIDGRFASLENRFDAVDGRFAAVDSRLDLMQQDMRNLNKRMRALRIDVGLVKDKLRR